MADGLEQKRMFRTSLSGFHKEDVNRYIAELSKKIEDVSARCQKAEQEAGELRGERDRAQQDGEQLRQELEPGKQEAGVAAVGQRRAHGEGAQAL